MPSPFVHGALAQLGARNTGSVEVTGSNPVCSTILKGRSVPPPLLFSALHRCLFSGWLMHQVVFSFYLPPIFLRSLFLTAAPLPPVRIP